ncbi:Hypothetical protein FKW44_016900 [Caligus rogercresseyi]|uniref:Uncharacterized protein n=1 Tax=Caligus rogercresseyi TaxID=217165 RepID=A0A7T8H321_CALRO|nr:Hypothetical protein FKW44_016900 [Caligus rogercresseyi]
MRLLLVWEVGEGGVRHTPQHFGVPEGLHQVGNDKLYPAEVSTACGRFRHRLRASLRLRRPY